VITHSLFWEIIYKSISNNSRVLLCVADGRIIYATKNGVLLFMRKLFLLLIAITMLTGFTSHTNQLKEQLEQMPHHYSQFDVKIAWNVSVDNSSLMINGIIKNIRYARMEDLEVWVSLIDANGGQVSRSVAFVIPSKLDKDDLAPFTIKLTPISPTGSKLLFTYKYAGSDGGDRDSGFWMQSFESLL
jgi:hypothetical protein